MSFASLAACAYGTADMVLVQHLAGRCCFHLCCQGHVSSCCIWVCWACWTELLLQLCASHACCIWMRWSCLLHPGALVVPAAPGCAGRACCIWVRWACLLHLSALVVPPAAACVRAGDSRLGLTLSICITEYDIPPRLTVHLPLRSGAPGDKTRLPPRRERQASRR